MQKKDMFAGYFRKKTKDENKTKIHDSKCASLYNRNWNGMKIVSQCNLWWGMGGREVQGAFIKL